VLSLTLGAFQLRSAHAEMKNRTVELGRQMYQLANASQHDVNKLSLNGQPMWVGSSTSNDTVDNVLARYQADCKKNAAQPIENWRELARNESAQKAEKSAMPDGVMRAGNSNEGVVVCFTKGDESKPTLKEAFSTFAETGELGALGNLRYVYVKKSERGNTIVLNAWTDNKFNLADLAPPEGTEARGSDFAEIPRPEGSLRIFSAQVEGTPFGVNVYRSKQGPENVVAFFDQDMGKRGWIALDPEIDKHGDEGAAKTQAKARLYERKGVVLTLASNVQDGDTVTALGLAGVTSSDGTKTDTGIKASDLKPGAKPISQTENSSSTAPQAHQD
jgi:hypothetical protein